jgi:hypothetical protein
MRRARGPLQLLVDSCPDVPYACGLRRFVPPASAQDPDGTSGHLFSVSRFLVSHPGRRGGRLYPSRELVDRHLLPWFESATCSEHSCAHK